MLPMTQFSYRGVCVCFGVCQRQCPTIYFICLFCRFACIYIHPLSSTHTNTYSWGASERRPFSNWVRRKTTTQNQQIFSRYMPPVTPSAWKSTRLADRFSPVCPQLPPVSPTGREALLEVPRERLAQIRRLLPLLSNQSEDCLYLNLYVPRTG